MVACDEKLELWEELEEVLTHEACGDFVAAGEVFQLRLGPSSPLFGFDGRHEARTTQPRHVGRVPVGACLHERVHRRVGCVVAEDGDQCVDEYRFPVRTGAVQEEQRVFLRGAGECIADHPLQIGLQFVVLVCYLGEEPLPDRAAIARRGRGDLGDPVGTFVRAPSACPEINHAAGRIEQPRVRVPFGGGGGMPAISARQPFDTADRAGTGEFGGDFCVVGLDRRMAADAADQVGCCQRILGAPALSVPHQPPAPGGDVAPIAVVAAGKGQRQRILGARHRFIVADHWRGIIIDGVHLQARTVREEGDDVEPLGHGVCRIPARHGILGRVEDVAGGRPRRQNGLRGLRRVVPARLVAVRPDQHRLTRQWRPIGLVDRGVGTVHGGGRHNAAGDQRLRALFAFDQHDLAGRHQPRLVVQGARVGWGHLAALGIPRPVLLLAPVRVVAVDDGDQLSVGIEVVPLRGGGAEIGHGRLPAGLAHRRRTDATEQIGGLIEHPWEVGMSIGAKVGGDQIEQIPALASGTINPQARLFSCQHYFETVAGIAPRVADEERRAALLACWKHGGQHGFQARDQAGADFDAFDVPVRFVGVHHLAPSVEVPTFGVSPRWTSVLRAAHADSSDSR